MRSTIARAALAVASTTLLTLTAPLLPARATVVDNDAFAAALALPSGASVIADTTNASQEDGELPPFQADVRAGAPDTSCNGGASVWYALPGGTGAVTLTASQSSFDAVIGLWEADSPSPALSDLAATDYSLRAPAGSGPATLSATLPAHGGWYFVQVDSCNTAGTATPASLGTVALAVTLQPRPVNDDLVAAPVLADHSKTVASTVGADAEANELPLFQATPLVGSPAFGCYGGSSVWYRLKHGVSYVRLQSLGTTFDSVIALWEDDVPGAHPGDLAGVNAALRPQNAAYRTLARSLNPASYYWVEVDTCNQPGAANSLSQGTVTFRTDYAAPLPAGYAGATTGVGESPVHARGVTSSGFTSFRVSGLRGSDHGLQASSSHARVVIRYVGTTLRLHFETYWKAGRVRVIVDRTPHVYDLYSGSHQVRDRVVRVTRPRGKHVVAIEPAGSSPRSHGRVVRLWLVSIKA